MWNSTNITTYHHFHHRIPETRTGLCFHGIFQRNEKTLPFLGKVQNRDGSGFWKPSERMSWNQLETCKISHPILAVKPLSHYKLDLQCSKLTGNLKHLCHQFALTVLEGDSFRFSMSSLLNHRLHGFSPTYPTPSSTTKTHTPKRMSPKGISITSQTSQPGKMVGSMPRAPATRWQKHTHRLVPKRWLSTKRNRNKGMCELPLWSNCRFFGGGLVPTKNRQVFVSQKQLRQWPPSCLSTVGAIKAQNQQIFIALPKIRFEATRCQMPTRVATHYHLAMSYKPKSKNTHKKNT